MSGPDASAAYRTVDVPVRGGALRVGVWEHPDDDADTTCHAVLLVHGVTASHRSWALVAGHLAATPGTRVLAPDLRGRGRSADLPGPWGMAQHADDLAAVVATLGPVAVTAGHSMGGFVVVVARHRHPEAFGSLVLVDGGVPLALPAGLAVPDVVRATLGPALDRLGMTFADHAAYRDFWRAHPAFAGGWSSAVEDYVDYDLVPTGPDGAAWRSGTHPDAVAQDTTELFADGPAGPAWAADAGTPTTFLRSPLGLQAQPPGLYPPEALAAFAADHPGLRPRDVAGTNHYTLTLGEPGARAVADAVRAAG